MPPNALTRLNPGAIRGEPGGEGLLLHPSSVATPRLGTQAVFLQIVAELMIGQAEVAGGRPGCRRPAQGFGQQPPGKQVFRSSNVPVCPATRRGGESQVGRRISAASLAIGGTLDEVFQLADVAGKTVLAQDSQRLGREPLAGIAPASPGRTDRGSAGPAFRCRRGAGGAAAVRASRRSAGRRGRAGIPSRSIICRRLRLWRR